MLTNEVKMGLSSGRIIDVFGPEHRFMISRLLLNEFLDEYQFLINEYLKRDFGDQKMFQLKMASMIVQQTKDLFFHKLTHIL